MQSLRRSSTARRPRACAKNGSPVHDREKSGPRGLLLVHVHPRAVSGAADDNGERGDVKPDGRCWRRRASPHRGSAAWLPLGSRLLLEVDVPSPDRNVDNGRGQGIPEVSRIGAAKLAVILAGESPANRGCPVAVVVISSNGKGDRPVESLEVKAPGGQPEYRSDPYRGASNLAGRSECAN